MAWTTFLTLLLFELAKGELGLPQFPPPQLEEVPVLGISQDDVREAFSYAQDQFRKRIETENKYLKSDNAISAEELSMDIRVIGLVDPKTIQLDRNQKLFEDASMWLSKKHNLTVDESVFGLQNVKLPEDLPSVQQCRALKANSPCDEKNKYRTFDGSCNNLLNPNWGQAYSCYNRLMKNYYADGLSSPRRSEDGSELPNGRLVSLSVVDDKDIPSPSVSQMLIGFAHFVSHDLSLSVSPLAGDREEYLSCCPKKAPVPELPDMCYPVHIPDDDSDFSKLNRNCTSLVRYAACSENCKLGSPRRHVNQHTSFIDSSQVYGVSTNQTRALRTLREGALKNQFSDKDELPPPSLYPKNDQCSSSMTNNHTCIQTGDYRAIQILGLTAMHIVFFREHNRLAKIISSDYPKLTDEEVFQEVRRILIAENQLITYKELLPTLLGPDLMEFFQLNVLADGYSTYNAKVDPRILSEHAVSSSRFGHTLVQRWYKQFDEDGKEGELMSLVYNLFRVPHFFEGKMDSITRGLCRQSTQSYDRHFVSPMTNGIAGAAGKQDGFDHVAFITQRGREVGAPPYVEILRFCYNVTIKSFDDLSLVMTQENLLRFQKAYRNVEEIDIYVAGFAETPIQNSVLGPTFACLTGQQYHNLKFGDRFYYEHGDQIGSFSEGQLKELRKLTLASMLCENTGVGKITKNVFRALDAENDLVDCTDIPSLDFKNWMDK